MLLDFLADRRLRNRITRLVAHIATLRTRNAALLLANKSLAATICSQSQAEQTLQTLLEHHKDVGIERLARIGELEEQLRQADADNAELSGRLADTEQRLAECKECL